MTTHYDPSSLALCAGCAHAGRFHQERTECETCGGEGYVVDTESGATEQEFLEGLRPIQRPCPDCSAGGCVADGCDCRKWEGTPDA